MERKFTIVSATILIEWSDSPKERICWNNMPDGLSQEFSDWLSSIEYERNKAEAG